MTPCVFSRFEPLIIEHLSYMESFLLTHWLDIVTTILGIVYLVLEYRASIALWIVGIVMPAMDIYLYWSHGLYGDAGMAVYYMLAAIYGYAMWKFGAKWKAMMKRNNASDLATDSQISAENPPITFFPRRLALRVLGCFFLAWAATYYVLLQFTNSTVPLLDAFTNAMSFVGLWALARKYVEQWLFWIAVDAVCCYLYVVKGIPFKAALYGLYVVIAVMGYWKWRAEAKKEL